MYASVVLTPLTEGVSQCLTHIDVGHQYNTNTLITINKLIFSKYYRNRRVSVRSGVVSVSMLIGCAHTYIFIYGTKPYNSFTNFHNKNNEK